MMTVISKPVPHSRDAERLGVKREELVRGGGRTFEAPLSPGTVELRQTVTASGRVFSPDADVPGFGAAYQRKALEAIMDRDRAREYREIAEANRPARASRPIATTKL